MRTLKTKFRFFYINVRRLLGYLRRKGYRSISFPTLYKLAVSTRKKDYPVPHPHHFGRFMRKYFKDYKIVKIRGNYYIILEKNFQ